MVRNRRGRPIHGWIALDKPAGLTAAAVVGRVKRALDAAKVGHGGTLDPLATGILPIALGEATKTANFIVDSTKTYVFEATWGVGTATDDSEGAVSATAPGRPERDAIFGALPAFTGIIQQTPPAFSAVKVAGERAYDLARKEKIVDLPARAVNVHRFALLAQPDADRARFEVECGKGTYIRALVRDLAQALGTVGHVSALRRTRCGVFDESTAISLANLEALGHKAADSAHLLPVATVLDDIPALALTEDEARRVKLGQAIALWPLAKRSPLTGLTYGMAVQARCGDKLIAVAEVGDGMVRPVRVMNN